MPNDVKLIKIYDEWLARVDSWLFGWLVGWPYG